MARIAAKNAWGFSIMPTMPRNDAKKIRVIDLFSGIGGFSYGLESTGGFDTAAFCEIEKFPQMVLKKHWPDVPLYNDVRELTGDRLKSDGAISDGDRIAIVCGYPCQPFSTAGKRKGKDDDRHLWPEVARLIRELQPAYGIFENVAGHISMGLDEVLSDLEGLGYTAEAFVIPACAVNAPHRRDRVWIIAYANSMQRLFLCGQKSKQAQAKLQGTCIGVGFSDAADTDQQGSQGNYEGRQIQGREVATGYPGQAGRSAWRVEGQTEPALCGTDDGLPCGMDRNKRLMALGNAIVPQIVAVIGKNILEREKCKPK